MPIAAAPPKANKGWGPYFRKSEDEMMVVTDAGVFITSDAAKTWRKVSTFPKVSINGYDVLLRPWLIGIARNLLREQVRRLKRRREVAWTELCLELETWHPPDDQRHDDAVRMLPDCLDSLGQTAREALDLHYRSSLRLAAIADRLHRSEGAVKLLLFRARQALRLCLNGKLRAEPHD